MRERWSSLTRKLSALTSRIPNGQLALLPLGLEGVVAGIAVAAGGLPAGASGSLATAVFPADAFFDLTRSLSSGRDWSWVLAAMLLSVLVRGATLAATLWLAGGRQGSLVIIWGRAVLLASAAWLLLLPAAAFLLTGSTFRYAPFVAVGALLGLAAAVPLIRRALRLRPHLGRTEAQGTLPGLSSWLGYASLIASTAFIREWLATHHSRAVVGLVVFLLAPLHAVVLLKWRGEAQGPAKSRRPVALIAMVLIAILFLGAAGYDRQFARPERARRLRATPLYLLGGADSTSKTGALSDMDVRTIGRRLSAARILSYRAGGDDYLAKDTHRDLSIVAAAVSGQLEVHGGRVKGALFGHSQAALIVDRMLASGNPLPHRIAVVSPSLPYPPRVHLPSDDAAGPGAPAADVERGLDKVFDLLRLPTLDLDAPAAPTNLRAVVVAHSRVRRLALWALGDSVWLDRDWRRPGEVNVVTLSDHVGAVRNPRTLEEARSFFAGRALPSDDRSWRGLLVNLIRYTFQPWRP